MRDLELVQEVINLSKEKWRWMSERKIDSVAALFHEKAVFVHLGGTWGREKEPEIIRSGRIHYKQADIHEVSVNIIGATATLSTEAHLQPWLAAMRSPIPSWLRKCMCGKATPGR
jgi:hypothetical protein